MISGHMWQGNIDYEISILDLMVEIDRLCTQCGNCCKDLTIPLTEIETPIIAKYLGAAEAVHK